MTENQESKRDFLKKAAYVVPTILTLKAIPTFAGSGSGRYEREHPPVYDGPESGNREWKFRKFRKKNRG